MDFFWNCTLDEGITNTINMLFASWEVGLVKNCDRGLERQTREASLNIRSQFFTIRTKPIPKPANNSFFFLQ